MNNNLEGAPWAPFYRVACLTGRPLFGNTVFPATKDHPFCGHRECGLSCGCILILCKMCKKYYFVNARGGYRGPDYPIGNVGTCLRPPYEAERGPPTSSKHLEKSN